MHGLGSGVFEIALPFRGDAFRVVRRAVRRGNLGRELELITDRLTGLKEM